METQPTEWEKKIANYISDRLTSKIYKELLPLTSKKPNNLIKKGVQVLNRHFSKEKYEWSTGI